jgi:hypothetical protein
LTVGVHMLESYLARLVNSRRYVMWSVGVIAAGLRYNWKQHLHNFRILVCV